MSEEKNIDPVENSEVEVVVDVDYSKGFVNAFAGNIRIVFERNE